MLSKILLIATIFTTPLFAAISRYEVEVGQGYQTGQLNWSIAGGPDGPGVVNVLSQLKWKDLKVCTTHMGAKAMVTNQFFLLAEGNYGFIYDGYNEDSDYSLPDKQGLYQYSKAAADKGEVYDYSFVVGHDQPYSGGRLKVRSLAGWGKDGQNVRMMSPATVYYDGNYDPIDPSDITGKATIDDLHSNYQAVWEGPWLGTALIYDTGRLQLMAQFDYHWLEYRAKANWNLRPELIDGFRHSGNGKGTKIRISGDYQVTQRIYFGFLTIFTDYKLRGGTDKIKLANPFSDDDSYPTTVKIRTRLNEVNWHSFLFLVNLGIRF